MYLNYHPQTYDSTNEKTKTPTITKKKLIDFCIPNCS